jgi:hypothetical protein
VCVEVLVWNYDSAAECLPKNLIQHLLTHKNADTFFGMICESGLDLQIYYSSQAVEKSFKTVLSNLFVCIRCLRNFRNSSNILRLKF